VILFVFCLFTVDCFVQLQAALQHLEDRDLTISALKVELQTTIQSLQRSVELYKAKPSRLQELSVSECDMLERELVASINKIRKYKVI
jgi:hypothetical protein